MIKVNGCFSQNEMEFITTLNGFFILKYDANGTVIDNHGFVRYEIKLDKEERILVLQFCVRDQEDTDEGYINFVHIINISVPYRYRYQHIASDIIYLMSWVANKKLGIAFYITGIVNDSWKRNLIYKGAIEDDNGDDVRIAFDRWKQNYPDGLRLGRRAERILREFEKMLEKNEGVVFDSVCDNYLQ